MAFIVTTCYRLPLDLLKRWINWHSDHQLIVVGDQAAVEYCLTYGVWCKLYEPEEGIFSICQAANIGIKAAVEKRAGVIIKTDIDCQLSPAVINACETIKLRTGKAFRYWHSPSGKLDRKRCGTIAMHRGSWEDCRGYDERMAGYGYDDADIIHRARAAGVRVDLVAEPRVIHHEHEPHNRDTVTPLRRAENIKIANERIKKNENC
jgi:hypothetical protein